MSVHDRYYCIRQKRIRGGGAFAKGNSVSLKQRWLLMNTPLAHASLGATQYSAACQTHMVHIELDGGRQGAENERGRMEDGREGARGGREEAMMIGRERASVEEGIESRWREGC